MLQSNNNTELNNLIWKSWEKSKPPVDEQKNSWEPSPNLDEGKIITQASLNLDGLLEDDNQNLINSIKAFIKENKRLPPTTLEYYKFVKLVGKGAFGKVTLGIHKLTGKKVAIKTIEKSYMKDEFSRKKVL